jgi:hypothetical protein
MPSDLERRSLSTTRYRPNSQLLFPVLFFTFFETAAGTNLFAQDRTQAETKPRVSLGVLIDSSAATLFVCSVAVSIRRMFHVAPIGLGGQSHQVG